MFNIKWLFPKRFSKCISPCLPPLPWAFCSVIMSHTWPPKEQGDSSPRVLSSAKCQRDMCEGNGEWDPQEACVSLSNIIKKFSEGKDGPERINRSLIILQVAAGQKRLSRGLTFWLMMYCVLYDSWQMTAHLLTNREGLGKDSATLKAAVPRKLS